MKMTTQAADLLWDAINIATRMHRGQYRKHSGEPYICHPLRVMEAVASKSMAVRIAAVLHDVVEDTEFTLDQVEEWFGSEVRRLVDALSRRGACSTDCGAHKERYRDFIDRIIAAGPDAVTIKLRDIEDNMASGGGQRDYSKDYKRLEAASAAAA